ncbi:response regulator [Pedobacter yulinensis]|uniref:Response regulator n=1 Tax=Pedobacter yulinensis TaxID=2126353 RepID=A0A2T3HK37_9SPHI|nr:response regulator [Pedobacter yulinensis]PST82828.1 response regulator [Pedobacter yulinensis]
MDSVKRILIVDDDKGILDSLTTLFELVGYTVDVLDNGLDLPVKLAARPDLILLDVMLQDTDGWFLCKFLKDSEKFKHIPVVMMSAVPDTGDLAEYGCKAEAFIQKPYSVATLVKTIDRLLKQG